MPTSSTRDKQTPVGPSRQELFSAVIRFAGDSGDGMQLTGGQFAESTAMIPNAMATFPDFPAEIRAPVGTTFGVSSFQINFGSGDIKTSGDAFDVLVAMNPAALYVELGGLQTGGIIVVDTGTFTERNLRKAGFAGNPLDDSSLEAYRTIKMDISALTLEAVKPFDLSRKDALRCKNLWTLGFVYWMFGRRRQATVDWLQEKFAARPEIRDANIAALNAGHAMAETAEVLDGFQGFTVPGADLAPGRYRAITGAEGIAWGLAAGCQKAGLGMVFCSYPITPASSILHILSTMASDGVTTFQAEDEIAAICAAIGASYGGAMGVTSSSGPGVALKSEALGLAVATELPLVLINSQRAGPSTGLPTKTEQSDLFQSVYGRNADSPLCVLAARSPADCFQVAVEAVRIATTFMTPVIVLSDGYIGNAAEPWLIPDINEITAFPVAFETNPKDFHPFRRHPDTLARPWVAPGTPDLEHRIGGIEKDYDSGHISYDPANHQRMTDVRAEKIKRIARATAPQDIEMGPDTGRLVIVGWGSTYGTISRAVSNALLEGAEVSHVHLRHIWPLPENLGDVLRRFEHVLVAEMNAGQLITLLRSEYLIDAKGVNKVTGQPFKITEIEAAIRAHL